MANRNVWDRRPPLWPRIEAPDHPPAARDAVHVPLRPEPVRVADPKRPKEEATAHMATGLTGGDVAGFRRKMWVVCGGTMCLRGLRNQ